MDLVQTIRHELGLDVEELDGQVARRLQQTLGDASRRYAAPYRGGHENPTKVDV